VRKIISLFIVLALLICLIACGNKNGNTSDDPNLGLWVAVTGEMWGLSVEVDDMFGAGFTIELKAGGKCALNVDGSKANGNWTLSGGAFTVKGGGLDSSGRLENGVLTLEDVMGLGLTLVFYKNGINPDAPASADGGDTGVPAKVLSEALAWWDGEWYGYWTAESASGKYADAKGGARDCYAVIDVDSDGAAVMYLWDDKTEIGTVEIAIEELGGVAPMGSAVSTGGEAFGVPLERADWILMPTYAGYEDYWGNSWYDDYMEFEGLYDTDEGYMRYTIVLRPWGILWDDIPEGKRTPDYDSWYVGENAYAKTMYDALYQPIDGVFIHPRLLDGATAGGSAGGGTASGGDTGGGAALSGPTAEYAEKDTFFIRYPTDTFEFDEFILPRIKAKDGSVQFTMLLRSAHMNRLEEMTAFLDGYSGYSGYSSETLTIAGLAARRVTYEDWGDYYSEIFIDFGHSGGLDGYIGISISIKSDKDFASTWTPEIRAILETIKVVQ